MAISREPLFVGVDGGGTRCRARLCDGRGRCLGEGIAGAANTRLGLDQAFSAIRAACVNALQMAGLPAEWLDQLHAGLGLAGLNLASQRARLDAYPHPFASMTAASDAYIACLGAHAGRDGGIVILGTGSCGCIVRNGHCCTLGGWGFQLGDQGSGARLGLQALRQTLLARDGLRSSSALSRCLAARFDDDPEALVHWAESAVPGDYATLAPVVFEHAQRGDPLALELVAATAGEAVSLIRAVHQRGAPHTALLGGLARPLLPYLPPATRRLLTEPSGDALTGALLLIRRDRGNASDP